MGEGVRCRGKEVMRGDIYVLFLVREKALEFFLLIMQHFGFGTCLFQVEFIKLLLYPSLLTSFKKSET